MRESALALSACRPVREKFLLFKPLCMLSWFSRVRLFAAPWTVARQAPLSMGFSRQEYWGGLPCPPPGDLPDPGIKPESPALALPGDSDGKASVYCTGDPVWSLGWEGKGYSHSSILAWKIPWTEEPGRLQSMGFKDSDMTERLPSCTGWQILYHWATGDIPIDSPCLWYFVTAA